MTGQGKVHRHEAERDPDVRTSRGSDYRGRGKRAALLKGHLAKVLNGQVPGVPDLPHLRLGRRKLIRRSMLYVWMAEVERAQSGMLSALPEVRAV